MITYDAKIIQAFADRLYQQAARIVFTYTLLYAIVGLLVGGALLYFTTRMEGSPMLVGGLVGALLFGAAGYAQGQAKAFALRLQAQMALCQVQIEENTRSDPKAGVNR